MAFSTELLYGDAVPERRAGDPAYFLDSSDLGPAREEAKAWFRAARTAAWAMGRTIPSAVVIMDDGREAFRYPATPTVSEPTSGRGGLGR
jgi:hypothetical protein